MLRIGFAIFPGYSVMNFSALAVFEVANRSMTCDYYPKQAAQFGRLPG
jgi:hypothetical protein